MAKKTAYQRKLDYNNAYNRNNYRSFSVRLDKTSEAKTIRWLEKQPGLKKYLIGLVEEDRKKKTAKKK